MTEELRDWYFTFGPDHTHPVTGESLGGCYVRLHGTCDSTRVEMFGVFGNRWSSQYPTAERVEKYSMREIVLPAADGAESGGFDPQLSRLLIADW